MSAKKANLTVRNSGGDITQASQTAEKPKPPPGCGCLLALLSFILFDPIRTLPGFALASWIIVLILIPSVDRANFALESLRLVFSQTWYPVALAIAVCAIIILIVILFFVNKIHNVEKRYLQKELDKHESKGDKS